MSDVVRVAVQDRVATVSLNRPDKLNAVSPEVFDGLAEAGRQIEADDEIRAVLITGEGRAFCSGLDLASLQAFGQPQTANGEAAAPTRDPQAGWRIWQAMD
jgi:enoyl-CoA hydratase/carnithine racemase